MIERLIDIWNYRYMIYNMVHRELRGKYKKSVLGFLWSLLTPLCQILVYTILFAVILKSGTKDYYVYLMAGIIPWTFFNDSLSQGSSSIIASADMVKKIYFPREVLPLAQVFARFVDFLLSMFIVLVITIYSGITIDFRLWLLLPIIMIIELVFSLGLALIVSAATVYLRDLEYIIRVLLMALIWMTPIMYEVKAVPANLYNILKLNPMVYFIDIFHDILYYHTFPSLAMLLVIMVEAVGTLIIGEVIFARLEGDFSEEL